MTSAPPLLQADRLAKSFGATRALVEATIEVRAGEVHTVAGENGSGKSTLVKIVSGVHRPDRGTLAVGGVDANRLRSPADARRLGVATVFQEVLTVPGRSVADNVGLGAPKHLGARTVAGQDRAAQLLGTLLGTSVDLNGPVDALSLSQRQACCIARSLLTDPRVLVLDESTSALDIATRDRLFELVRDLTSRGSAVVFISHRMDEVFELTDVVTVLRSGTTVASRVPIGELSVGTMVSLMSGSGHRVRDVRARTLGAPVLRAAGLVLRRGAAPVDLEVRAGELFGLAGLEGQGQQSFLAALQGTRVLAGRVERIDGSAVHEVTDLATARRHGIAGVPRERRHAALFEQLSVRENFGLPTMRKDTRAGLLRPGRTDQRLREFAKQLRLKMGRPGDAVTTLSGGNQQKVVLARALGDRPSVLLLDDPTRGIDLGAKQDVYDLLGDLCAAGTAVVIISSEVDELVELADRVAVFRDQTLGAVLSHRDVSREAIVSAYFGVPVTIDEPGERQAALPRPSPAATRESGTGGEREAVGHG